MEDENDYEDLQTYLNDHHKAHLYEINDDFVNYIEENDHLGTSVQGDWNDLY